MASNFVNLSDWMDLNKGTGQKLAQDINQKAQGAADTYMGHAKNLAETARRGAEATGEGDLTQYKYEKDKKALPGMAGGNAYSAYKAYQPDGPQQWTAGAKTQAYGQPQASAGQYSAAPAAGYQYAGQAQPQYGATGAAQPVGYQYAGGAQAAAPIQAQQVTYGSYDDVMKEKDAAEGALGAAGYGDLQDAGDFEKLQNYLGANYGGANALDAALVGNAGRQDFLNTQDKYKGLSDYLSGEAETVKKVGEATKGKQAEAAAEEEKARRVESDYWEDVDTRASKYGLVNPEKKDNWGGMSAASRAEAKETYKKKLQRREDIEGYRKEIERVKGEVEKYKGLDVYSATAGIGGMDPVTGEMVPNIGANLRGKVEQMLGMEARYQQMLREWQSGEDAEKNGYTSFPKQGQISQGSYSEPNKKKK